MYRKISLNDRTIWKRRPRVGIGLYLYQVAIVALLAAGILLCIAGSFFLLLRP